MHNKSLSFCRELGDRLLLYLTLVIGHWLAFSMASEAQQTRALELDKPADRGTVPSTIALKPLVTTLQNCSWTPFTPHSTYLYQWGTSAVIVNCITLPENSLWRIRGVSLASN